MNNNFMKLTELINKETGLPKGVAMQHLIQEESKIKYAQMYVNPNEVFKNSYFYLATGHLLNSYRNKGDD